MNQLLAVGIDSFKKIREENFFYIDKSMLISEFMTTGQK